MTTRKSGRIELWGDWVLNTTGPVLSLDYGSYWVPIPELGADPIHWVEHIQQKHAWPPEVLGNFVRCVVFLFGNLTVKLARDEAERRTLCSVVYGLTPREDRALVESLRAANSIGIDVGEYIARAKEMAEARGTSALAAYGRKRLKLLVPEQPRS